jgi:hypothetical protein
VQAYATRGRTSKRRLLLDRVSVQPLAAFSAYRKLRASYTGAAFRVRRASDNAELDIGFRWQYVDLNALLVFCAGTTGFVKSWYDQTTNVKDLTQATTTKQPIIYASGAIAVNASGKPAFKLDGVDDYLGRADALGLTGSPALTVASVVQTNGDDGLAWGFGGSAGGASWCLELWKSGNIAAITQTVSGFRTFTWTGAKQTGPHAYICGKAASALSGGWTCEEDGVALSQSTAHGSPLPLNLVDTILNIGTGSPVGQFSIWTEQYHGLFALFNSVLAGDNLAALREESDLHR